MTRPAFASRGRATVRRICPACQYTGAGERCPFCGGEMRTASKYGNRRGATTPLVVGRTFDSQREANRAGELVLLERAGEIRGLAFQVTYPLTVNGVKIASYRADFTYEELWPKAGEWHPVTEDSKGAVTPVFRIKRALMRACHGVEVRET